MLIKALFGDWWKYVISSIITTLILLVPVITYRQGNLMLYFILSGLCAYPAINSKRSRVMFDYKPFVTIYGQKVFNWGDLLYLTISIIFTIITVEIVIISGIIKAIPLFVMENYLILGLLSPLHHLFRKDDKKYPILFLMNLVNLPIMYLMLRGKVFSLPVFIIYWIIISNPIIKNYIINNEKLSNS